SSAPRSREIVSARMKFAIASRGKMRHVKQTARGFSPILHPEKRCVRRRTTGIVAGISVGRMLTRYNPSILMENGAVRPRSTAEFSGVQMAVLFAALALVASIPIITHPLPPLSDYVNHLARMHVIASIGHDSDLSRFYQIDWQIIPNLIMDIVVPRL